MGSSWAYGFELGTIFIVYFSSNSIIIVITIAIYYVLPKRRVNITAAVIVLLLCNIYLYTGTNLVHVLLLLPGPNSINNINHTLKSLYN